MWMKRIRSRKKRSKEERESTKDGRSLHPARSYSWLTQLFHDSFVVRRQSRLRFMLTRLNYFGEGSIDNKQRSRFREYSRFYSLGKKERKKEEEQDGLKTFIFFRSYFPTHICRPLQEWKIHMSSCTLTGRDILFESWVHNSRKKNPWLRLPRLHLWKEIFLKFSNDAAKNCKWYVSLIILIIG